MTTNGIDGLADQLKAAEQQYRREARELEEQAAALAEKANRMKAAVTALIGGNNYPAHISPWSAEDDAKLRAAWGKPGAARIAAEATGRTQGACYQRAIKLGLPSTKKAAAAPPVAVAPDFSLPGYAPI